MGGHCHLTIVQGTSVKRWGLQKRTIGSVARKQPTGNTGTCASGHTSYPATSLKAGVSVMRPDALAGNERAGTYPQRTGSGRINRDRGRKSANLGFAAMLILVC